MAELDNEKADMIIDLLKDISKKLDRQTSGPTVEDRPWAYRLVSEHATGEDTDGNGMVYGHDFVFNQALEWHPPALQGIAKMLKKDFKGKTITLLEYVESLDPEDPKVDKIYEYIKAKQQLNG